jgi:hypothetical protein
MHLPAKESTYLQGGNDNISKTSPEFGQEQFVSALTSRISPIGLLRNSISVFLKWFDVKVFDGTQTFGGAEVMV